MQQQQQQQVNQGQNNVEYYNEDEQQQYYYNQQPTTQTYSDPSSEPPQQQKHSMRSQPTSTNRIEASHAEDVLTLSLELERVRSQLASTTSQLTATTSQLTTLQTQNDHLQTQNDYLHSQLETHNERSSTQLLAVQTRLDAEGLRAKAAEEDAALALELAKEAQVSKEECELWLSRSLEEIDLWKGRCDGLEQQLKEQQQHQPRGGVVNGEDCADGEEDEPKKLVRFKEDCPPSPVVSEDGGYDDGDGASPAEVVNVVPPPPPPPPPVWSTPVSALRGAAPSNDGTNNYVVSSPNVNNGGTNNNNDAASVASTPSKSAIASGRAFLHRASPSPHKDGGGISSPHPRVQASELLKRSAETRRLLRERLTPGGKGSIGGGGGPSRPPVGVSKLMIPRVSSDPSLLNNNMGNDTSFASRQGVACKSVGRTIRESGARLKLNGKWWDTLLLTNSNNGGGNAGVKEIEGVAQLESMVKDYCGGVEGTIGQQREKINELLAFCDHLEKEVMLPRE
ncbi:hypothetical protein ACHAXR_001949 [Thalassiosira sp. AJA248-18]